MKFIPRDWDLTEHDDFTRNVNHRLAQHTWAVPACGWYSDDENPRPVVAGWFLVAAYE